MLDSDQLSPKRPDARGSAVPADMAAIFADLRASGTVDGTAEPIRAIRPAGRARRGSARRTASLALMAAAVVGISLLLASGDRQEARPTPDRRAQPQIALSTTGRYASGTSAGAPPSLEVTSLAQPAPPRAEAPVRTPRARTTSATIKTAATSARSVRTRRTRPAYTGSADACAGTVGDDRARCLYPEILRGDDALRAAYARAVDAGVTGQVLSPIRNRWARLRRNTQADPDGTADGYRQLAREVQALRRVEAEAAAPRTDNGH